MQRHIVLHIPQWDLENYGPHAVVLQAGRVAQLSVAAARAGVSAGMRLRTARQLCPDLQIATADLSERLSAFTRVYEAAASVIPHLTFWWPGRLSALASGPAKYWGSEQNLLDQLVETVTAQTGLETQCGIASGILGATLAARRGGIIEAAREYEFTDAFELGALLDLYPASQRHQPADICEQLQILGISTIGQLRLLGASAAATRFGAEGLNLYRLACGANPFQQKQIKPESEYVSARIDCEIPLESAGQARLYARYLGTQLAMQLRAKGVAPRRVEVMAVAVSNMRFKRGWNLLDQVDEADLEGYVQALCEAATGELDSPVLQLHARACQLVPLAQLQSALFGQTNPQVHTAAVKLLNIVGEQAVRVPCVERGYSYRERNQTRPWKRFSEPAGKKENTPLSLRDKQFPGALTDPFPLTLFSAPKRLLLFAHSGEPVSVDSDGCLSAEVAVCHGEHWQMRVERSYGPWRVLGKWWQGQSPNTYLRLESNERTILAVYDHSGWWLDAEY